MINLESPLGVVALEYFPPFVTAVSGSKNYKAGVVWKHPFSTAVVVNLPDGGLLLAPAILVAVVGAQLVRQEKLPAGEVFVITLGVRGSRRRT